MTPLWLCSADDLIQELSSNDISRDATIHVDITVPTVGMMKAEVLLATRKAFRKLTLLADYITTFFVFVIIFVVVLGLVVQVVHVTSYSMPLIFQHRF